MTSESDPTSETERLCRFLATTETGDVSRPVAEHAKSTVFDTVGVTVAGIETDAAALARETTRLRVNGDGPRLVGTDLAGPAGDVAFASGVASHALDFDDVHHRMGGHPRPPCCQPSSRRPSAAVRAARHCSGRSSPAVRRQSRSRTSMNPGHYERRWHPTSVLGTLGAAAGVGVLFDLDAERLRHAVGVAASGAGGLKGNFGTMTKPYHVGDAARTGLEVAELAAEGFTANPGILETPFGGFCDCFEGDPPHDFDDHLERLGDPWKIRSPPVAFKPYPLLWEHPRGHRRRARAPGRGAVRPVVGSPHRGHGTPLPSRPHRPAPPRRRP